jgi:hypothetical protein
VNARGVASAILASSLLATTAANAERILLIEDPTTQRFAGQLRAELTSLGFEVASASATDAVPSRQSLEDAARTSGAIAALRVHASRAGVEVWVMDRVTSKTLLREFVLSRDEGGAEADSAVALGAVELLRASLLEVEQPHYVPKEVPVTPAVERLIPRAAHAPPRVTLALGPAAAWSVGGLAVTPHIDVWMRLRASDSFALTTRLVLPTIPATVEGREGRATVTLAGATVGGDALLLPQEGRFQVRTGAGVGVLWAHMEGTATPTFVGRGDDVVTTLSFLHSGASARLSRSVFVFADATLALASPRPVIVFADRTVAAWGQPATFFTVGLELPLSF